MFVTLEKGSWMFGGGQSGSIMNAAWCANPQGSLKELAGMWLLVSALVEPTIVEKEGTEALDVTRRAEAHSRRATAAQTLKRWRK
jgi:hypothetical protein